MAKPLLFLVLALAGCADLSVAQPQYTATSPCQLHEASYACQVERYHNVNVP